MSLKEMATSRKIHETLSPDLLTMQTDKDGPYYDPRHELPLKEETVNNIMAYGVRQPIEVAKHEDKYYIVEGRQRYKHWCEALKRWNKNGEEPKPLPFILTNVNPKDGEVIAVSLNEHRQDDSPILKAEKAARLLALGHSEEQVADAFRIQVQQLKNWLKVNELCSPVKKMIEQGKISATAASKFHDLPAEEQKDKVKELIESGAKPTVKNAEKKKKGKKVSKKEDEPKAWSKAQLLDLADMADTPKHFSVFIKYILGECPIEEVRETEGLEFIK